MKKRFIPLLALLLSLCIIVPVSIAQIMAAGAVQINVTAKGGSVVIDSHAVAGGSSYNVEENATVPIEAVPQDGYVFDSWSVTGGTIAEDMLKKNPATLSVTTEAVTLTAKFQKTLTVTLKQAEGGMATITPTDKAVGHTETTSDDVEVSNTSSESIKNIKFKADCAHPWEEIPFTITDVNSNVKQAKIVLDYPSKGIVSIEGTGKVTVNGSEYANGDVVKAVTGAELKLQATEASTFAGWEVSGTNITLTEEQAKANPLTITAPEGSFAIKAKFQKTLTVTLNQAEGGKATIMKTDKAISSTATTVTGVDNNSGDMVAELTATPNAGYAFSGWKVTYLKNGKEHDAYAKGTNMRYQYVIDGNVSKDSIKVGFNDNGTKMYAIYTCRLLLPRNSQSSWM